MTQCKKKNHLFNLCKIITRVTLISLSFFLLSETTEAKLGIVVTFAKNIPLADDYANVVKNMETSV